MINRFLILIVLLTGIIINIHSQDIELQGDTTRLRLIDESGQQRIFLLVREDMASISVWDTEGKELAVLGSSIGQIASQGELAQGEYGVLSLSSDTEDISIIAVGASANDGTPALLSLRADSAFLKLRTPTSSEALQLFAKGNKSGIVLSDPDGKSVAQLITSEDGKSGKFALDNDQQKVTVFAQGGSPSSGSQPLISVTGDSSSIALKESNNTERLELFVRDNKSGITVSNPEGKEVAQLTTSPDGEFGIFGLDNDEQVSTIFATGGSNFDNIPPAIRIEGETTKMDFVGDTLSNLSLQMNGGKPMLRMYDDNGDRLVSLGMGRSGFGRNNMLQLYKEDSIFFDLRYLSVLKETSMKLRKGAIGLYNLTEFSPYALLDKDENGGRLTLSNLDASPKEFLKLTTGKDEGYGSLGLFGENGSLNILATEPVGAKNHGALSIINHEGEPKVRLFSTNEGNGEIDIRGANGNNNIYMSITADANRPYLHLANTDGKGRAGVLIDGNNKGYMFSEKFALIDTSNTEVAKIFINGSGDSEVNAHTISATVKSFKMDHPSQSDKEIWYASIEGPEAAAYVRGTGTLSNGKATIHLPDYFSEIVELKGMTVLLTPLSGTSKGMAVTSKNVDQFSVVELLDGIGSYQFDWEVKGVRSGLENFKVVRDKPRRLKNNIQNILQKGNTVYEQRRIK